MDSAELIDLLRNKAVLLLRREGEVFQLRQERSRIELWLKVFHELSLDLRARKPAGLLNDWALAMVGNMSFQIAAAYECDPALERLKLVASQSHVPLRAELPLDQTAQARLLEQRGGRYEAPAQGALQDVARALELELFFWQTVRSRKGNLLFLCGFAAGTGKVYSLNDYDFSYFVLSTKHVAALLENIALIEELDRERSELSVSNAQLDQSLRNLREAQNKALNSSRALAEVSRRAGMADIATGVLHNVGNVLNSVNISAEVAAERLHAMKISGVARVADLLAEDAATVPSPEAARDRAAKVGQYLRELGAHLTAEAREIAAELRSLQQNIDHIKSIVSKQQAYARAAAGVTEPCNAAQLLDDALGLTQGSLAEPDIQVVRDYAVVPTLLLERHKVLQILVNLVSNAKNALAESDAPEKVLTLFIAPLLHDKIRLGVQDTGVGIDPEHMPKLFTHGFTTRKDGHGFGLHTSAIAAREMGGSLTASSQGRGRGATFVLELPARFADAPEEGP